MNIVKHNNNNSILIADDSQDFLRAAETHLKRCGFSQIFTALNGSDAVIISERIRPDLVLLDVEMPPGMSGFDVLRKFHERRLNFKVILITAHDSGLVGMQGAKLGITDFVPKIEFFDVIAVKVLEALDFGHTIFQENISPKRIISTNIDILKNTVSTSEIYEKIEIIQQLDFLLMEVKKPNPNKKEIGKVVDFIKTNVAGNLVATGIIKVVSSLLSLI